MASEASSTSSAAQPAASSKDERESIATAFNHLVQGKRHLLVRDIPSASGSLAKACELLAAKYGEFATECGDAYLHYGIALLETARSETGILANKVENDDTPASDNEDDDENEEESEGDEEEEEEKSTDGCVEVADALADGKECAVSSSSAAPVADSEAKSEDIDSDKAENECDKDAVPSDEATTKVVGESSSSTNDIEAVPGTSAGTSSVTKDEGGESEEVTSLQLAWEVLELAKVIYLRQDASKRGMQLKLAEVYSKLGEVAMESENYPQSIEDLGACLRIQKEILPADDRGIAEAYYNLGLVYSLCEQFDTSIESFQNARAVLQSRTDNLKKNIADNTFPNVPGVDDPVAAAQNEIAELGKLIEEILEKIADIEDLKKNHEVKLSESVDKDMILAKANEAFDAEAGKEEAKPKPVSNIGHLVRKKRKPEDDVGGAASTSSDFELKKKRVEGCFQIGTNNGTAGPDKETQFNGVSSTDAVTVPNKHAAPEDQTPGEAAAQ